MSGATAVPRIRLRAALAFATLGALLAGGASWVVLERLDRTIAERRSEELARRGMRFDAELRAIRERQREPLERLVAGLGADVDALRDWRAGGSRAAGLAPSLAARGGFGHVWLVDADGTLAGSTWWPERVGLPAPELPLADRGGAAVVDGPDGARPLVVSSVEAPALGPDVRLVAGTAIDERLLAGIAGDGAATLTLAGASVQPPSSPRAGWSGPLVGHDGSTLGTIRLWLPADRWAQVRAGLRRDAMWLAALAALLGGVAGALVAAALTRPVQRLVDAVGEIDAGEADYGFERPVGDELDAVAGSLSRTRRELELQRERSRSAERVAAWREVARRVAHEVKNPLAPIRLTAQNLQRARQTDQALFDELFDDGMRTVLEEVAQLERLVGEFSSFARLPEPVPTPADPARLLDEVLALHRAEPRLELLRHGPSTLPGVRLDEDQIRRALGNVVGNAIEAMRELAPGAPRRLVATLSGDDGVVTIELVDSGPGPPDGEGATMLRPYFTTKAHGTGLGLAIVDRIVAQHGGALSIGPADGGGCRVVIRLPHDAGSPAGESEG